MCIIFNRGKEPTKAKVLRAHERHDLAWKWHCGPLQDAISHASCAEELGGLHWKLVYLPKFFWVLEPHES